MNTLKSNTIIIPSMLKKMTGIKKSIVTDLMDCYEEVIHNCEIILTPNHSIYATFGCYNESIITYIFVLHYNDDLMIDIIRKAHLHGVKYQVITLGDIEIPDWMEEETIDRNYQEMMIC